jgi:hypothetical protein
VWFIIWNLPFFVKVGGRQSFTGRRRETFVQPSVSARAYFFSSFIGGLMPVGDGPPPLGWLVFMLVLDAFVFDAVVVVVVGGGLFVGAFDDEQPVQQTTAAVKVSSVRVRRILVFSYRQRGQLPEGTRLKRSP